MMGKSSSLKLFFCYIDGMDLHRINNDYTPFILEIIKSYPRVSITSPPGTDSLPTLLTGTYPDEHGMWGVKLKNDLKRSLIDRLIDQIPDIVTTATQCLFQLLTNSFDLPAIPPRRRRSFKVLRTQHNKRYSKTNNLLQIGGFKTCLGVVGINRSKYVYSITSNPTNKFLDKLASGNYTLEILHLYSLDLIQRWNLDRDEKVFNFYRLIDLFVENLYEKCLNNGMILVFFTDHGYDRVIEEIDLKRELRNLGVSEDEYSYFIELSMARFWFHTENARMTIIEMLEELENTITLSWQDLHKYHFSFADSQYGEVFSMTHPGYIFFPNDFYHPIANLYLGLSDSKQRARIFDARHRGDHALLPQFESAKGFMVLLDKGYKAASQEVNLVDVAPTLLEILGYQKPDSMRGFSAFHDI